MSAPITITGRLGADPEIKFAANGRAIANMRVVTDKRTKNEQGEWISTDTTWWRVSAFGQTAENVGDNLTKGDAVIIVGNIKGREWDDTKTGEKRTALEVIANHIGADLSKAKPKQATAAADPWGTSTPQQSADMPF
jgi:single-strand DNA-binding protein